MPRATNPIASTPTCPDHSIGQTSIMRGPLALDWKARPSSCSCSHSASASMQPWPSWWPPSASPSGGSGMPQHPQSDGQPARLKPSG
eukprot:2672816-Heterocapsa_arctica.AAC.1